MSPDTPMPAAGPSDRREKITRLLAAWNEGDPEAFESLIPLVIHDLRKLARRAYAKEAAGHTLQPTALINELYLRWSRQQDFHWRNRSHFFALAAAQIRHILVDHARRKQAAKRGPGEAVVRLSDLGKLADGTPDRSVDLIDLDRQLKRLEEMDPPCSRIVELRYFAGLSASQVAEVMDLSERTVLRRWAWAKAWLFRHLKPAGTRDG